ncbi:MAG: hypothetical protein WCY86_07410, partial [Spirosomataceae bacterium]
MQSPAGLSINFPTLYVCESQYGLKIFDVSDKYKVDEHLIAHEKGMEAYDVISLGQNLMLIGKDGLYQYNAADPKKLVRLSHIPVVSPPLITEKREY